MNESERDDAAAQAGPVGSAKAAPKRRPAGKRQAVPAAKAARNLDDTAAKAAPATAALAQEVAEEEVVEAPATAAVALHEAAEAQSSASVAREEAVATVPAPEPAVSAFAVPAVPTVPVQAFVQSGIALACGGEALGRAWADLARAAAEANMAAARALAGCRNMRDLAEAQAGWLRASVAVAVDGGTKLNEIALRTADQAFAPGEAGLARVIETTARRARA